MAGPKGLSKEAVDSLKEAIATARKRDLSFGLCLGKETATTVLTTHKTKDPEAMKREAKQKGETNKIAWGMMSVKGKDVQLSCVDPAIPPGLARKTRELLKLAGVKSKVTLLDAEGNVLEADDDEDDLIDPADEVEDPVGDSTEEAAAAADPDAAKWVATREKLAAALERAAAVPGIDLTAARAGLAEADERARGGDAAGAVASAPALARLITEAAAAAQQADGDRVRWEAAAIKIRPLVDEAVAAGTPVAGKISAVWSFAQSKAQGNPPDFASAVKSITMIVKLLHESRAQMGAAPQTVARADGDPAPVAELVGNSAGGGSSTPPPSAPVTPPTGGASAAPPVSGAPPVSSAPQPTSSAPTTPGEPANLDGTGKEKFDRAEAALKAVDALIVTYLALIPGSAETMPAAWTAARAKIDSVLAPMRAPGAVLDDKKLETALKDLATWQADVTAKSTAKAEWKKTLDLFDLRMVPVERHAHAGAVPQVKPKIDAIKADLAKAVLRADKQEFGPATTAVQALYPRCDTVEALADAFAHYNSVHGHRTTVVNKLLGVVTGVADVDKLIRAQEKLLTDAEALALTDKFADAVKKLDAIPPIDDQLRRIFARKANYDDHVTNCTNSINAIDALPQATRDLMAADITKWKADFAAAKFAVTKDYTVSAGLMSALQARATFLENGLKAADAYLTKLAAFEAQFKIFTDHKGRPGIEEQYLAMERDLTTAKSEAAAGKHATASALLDRSKPTWPAMTTAAADSLTYITKRDELTPKVAEQKARAGSETPIAQAEGLMSTAATQALNKDFTGALANLTEAEKRIADAKAAADAAEALGKLKDGPALDGMAADFDKAFAVYTKMRANVAGKDPAGHFATLLAAADATAKLASDEKAKAAPDFAVARGHLDTAIAQVETALPKVLAKKPFDDHLDALNTKAATLTALNIDDCIKNPIATIGTRVTEAKALAAAPGFDFPGAEAKVAEAMALADKATADAALWPNIKNDRAVTIAIKTNINTKAPAIVTLMAKRIADIDALVADIDAKVAAGDFAGAKTRAEAGKALNAPTLKDLVTCAAFVTNRQGWFTGWLPQIEGPGKEAGVALLAKARAKLADAEGAMAAGNFDVGLNMLDEVSWAVVACDAAIKGHATYEPARVIAAASIKSVADIRNAGVEAALAPIEKKYADAVAEAALHKYRPAEAVMKAIPAEANPLVPKAQAWKAYDDARAPALAKLTEAEGHKGAAAILPMTQRLRAKYDAAVKQSDTDAAGAKAQMDEILAAATQAIATAATSAAFGEQADKMGDAGPDPAMVAQAKSMLATLRAKPEAPAAKGDLDEAAAQITSLEASGVDPAAAKAAFKAATDALTRAEVAIQQATMIGQAVKTAQDRIAALRGHAQKDYIAPDLAALDTAAADVLKQAQVPGNAANASANLETVMADIAKALTLADKQAEYLDLRSKPDVEPRIEVLEKHKHRYAIKANLDTMKAKLKDATDRSAARKPDEALKLTQEVRDLGLSSLVMADMRENDATKPPKVADIKVILARPDGQAEIDAMMAELEPDAKRAILRVVFEARFGCKLENVANKNQTGVIADGNLDGPNIQRFYEVMSDLPPQDVVANDSMRQFTIIEANGGGSFYEGGDKKNVVMHEGSEVLSSAYRFGQELEVGGADEDAKPANNDEVTFFSWNTMHEVGHAVDDKHGFMDKNGSNPTYGGWTTYGRNVQPVAAALVAEFKYDATYTAQYLAHNPNPAPVPPPDGVTPEDWESRRVRMRAWVDMASVGNNPWASNAVAARLAIGDKVYHESYANSWSSYSLAARKKGMTGYQFRAPGEWFAELYAAYHAGKLKSTHPAAEWLSKL
jgi:hypothetical protein